jgi:hypothetical protein
LAAELAGASGLPPVEKIRLDFDWIDRRAEPERQAFVAILNMVQWSEGAVGFAE